MNPFGLAAFGLANNPDQWLPAMQVLFPGGPNEMMAAMQQMQGAGQPDIGAMLMGGAGQNLMGNAGMDPLLKAAPGDMNPAQPGVPPGVLSETPPVVPPAMEAPTPPAPPIPPTMVPQPPVIPGNQPQPPMPAVTPAPGALPPGMSPQTVRNPTAPQVRAPGMPEPKMPSGHTGAKEPAYVGKAGPSPVEMLLRIFQGSGAAGANIPALGKYF